MKLQRHIVILACIFFATLTLRLVLSFQSQYVEYDGYFTIRQVEHIRDTGLPLFKDDLSYGGRIYIYPPAFQYLLAGFSLFMPVLLAAKLVPAILASSIVVVVFLICHTLTGKKGISLFAASLSGFVPAFFSSTINAVSVYSFVVPLFFLIVYLLLNLKQQGCLYYLLVCLLVLVFSHPIIFVFILALIVYQLLLRIEGFETRKVYLELLLFLTFFAVWINLFIYNRAFLQHGISIIWQNIPDKLLDTYFIQVSYLQVIYLVGFIPLVFGLFAVYHVLFRHKRSGFLLVISLTLTFSILLLLRLVPLLVGLSFLSILLTVLSAHSFEGLVEYLKKTKFSSLRPAVFGLVILAFVFTSLLQALVLAAAAVKDSPSARDVDALVWLGSNSHPSQTVLASIDEGFAVQYYSQRKTVADTNFLLVSNINTRYDEITRVLDLKLETEAVRILNRYDVNYLFFSEKQLASGLPLPSYLSDYGCFTLVYNETVKIYNVHCELR